MKKVKKVVGVAFIEDGKLLIVRSVRSSKSNTWTLIGGGVEEGESEVEAAAKGLIFSVIWSPIILLTRKLLSKKYEGVDY